MKFIVNSKVPKYYDYFVAQVKMNNYSVYNGCVVSKDFMLNLR